MAGNNNIYDPHPKLKCFENIHVGDPNQYLDYWHYLGLKNHILTNFYRDG